MTEETYKKLYDRYVSAQVDLDKRESLKKKLEAIMKADYYFFANIGDLSTDELNRINICRQIIKDTYSFKLELTWTDRF